MKFIHKNKTTLIVIAIFIILVILGANVYNLLVPNSGKALYGNRLDGKEAVKVTTEVYSSVKDKLKAETSVSKVETDERGRLINILITVKNDTELTASKTLAAKALEPFSTETKAYFDFQVIILKEDNKDKTYPIFGYKHHSSADFVWTKDRVNK